MYIRADFRYVLFLYSMPWPQAGFGLICILPNRPGRKQCQTPCPPLLQAMTAASSPPPSCLSLSAAEVALSWTQHEAKVKLVRNRADCYGNICLFRGGVDVGVANCTMFLWVTPSEYKLCGLLWRARGRRRDSMSLAWANNQTTSPVPHWY